MRGEPSYNPANVIAESELHGWTLGYIGVPWPGPWPQRSGDLFVTDPNGGQAGLAWESSGPSIQRISGATEGRWGVFQVLFPLPVFSEQDLIRNFCAVLPLLQEQKAKADLARLG